MIVMKRFFFIMTALLLTLTASAQYAYPDAVTAEIKGSRLFVDGEKLSKDEAVLFLNDRYGMDVSQDYLKYRKGYKAGLGMTIGGASCAVAGLFVTAGAAVAALVVGVPSSFAGKEVPKGIDIALGIGYGSVIGGTAVMLAGIPTLCVYKKRLNGVEAGFGIQENGVGLAFRF